VSACEVNESSLLDKFGIILGVILFVSPVLGVDALLGGYEGLGVITLQLLFLNYTSSKGLGVKHNFWTAFFKYIYTLQSVKLDNNIFFYN
jgi:hypothetical protein